MTRTGLAVCMIAWFATFACTAAPPAHDFGDDEVAPKKTSKDDDDPNPPIPTPSSAEDAGTTVSAEAGAACSQLGASRPCTATCVGVERCKSSGTGGTLTWGACECGVVEVLVAKQHDCFEVECPMSVPHLVGCRFELEGNDPRGCVARTPGSSKVFVKEGDSCSAGKVAGSLFCSSQPASSPALDAQSCPTNKVQPRYVTSRDECPD